jgi:hypothetical protein
MSAAVSATGVPLIEAVNVENRIVPLLPELLQ